MFLRKHWGACFQATAKTQGSGHQHGEIALQFCHVIFWSAIKSSFVEQTGMIGPEAMLGQVFLLLLNHAS